MRRVSAVLLVVFAGMAYSTVFPHIASSQSALLATDEMVQHADVIVVGKVTDIQSEWNSDRSRILTNVTVQVEQLIKGENAERFVTISTLGGEIDGVGELYSHTARFKADEQVVVFAATDRQGQLRVVGGDEGKLTVTRDEVTGLRVVADSVPLAAYTSRIKSIVEAQSYHE